LGIWLRQGLGGNSAAAAGELQRLP
jgi:hypothetical protein